MDDQVAAAAGAVAGGMLFVWLVILIAIIASVWKIFAKAGQPGWAALIPIYNTYVFLQVAGKPGWWLLLLLVPLVNLVVGILACLSLAERFGKGGGFALGLVFLPLIFLPILGFGGARYSPTAA